MTVIYLSVYIRFAMANWVLDQSESTKKSESWFTRQKQMCLKYLLMTKKMLCGPLILDPCHYNMYLLLQFSP